MLIYINLKVCPFVTCLINMRQAVPRGYCESSIDKGQNIDTLILYIYKSIIVSFGDMSHSYATCHPTVRCESSIDKGNNNIVMLRHITYICI